MSPPRPIPGILDIAPYIGGDAKAEGAAETIKLSSNESPLGPSPRALRALAEIGPELHRYPDGGANALRHGLAAHYGLDPAGIFCGNGSDELISYLTHAYAGPGDDVVFSEHGFLMYPLSAQAAGARPIKAPECAYTADPEALLAALTPATKIVFIANPNNPTGTYLPIDALADLRAGLSDDVLLVIDCAYAEYVSRNDYAAPIELVEAHDNVVMTRTFSKIYGLAALRLGWAYGPRAIADVFHRVRPPFNVNMAAQAAGIAALNDSAHTEAARAHNDRWLPWFRAEIEALGLAAIPSVANFLTVDFSGRGDGAAAAAHAALKAAGVLPRAVGAYGLANHLRFTIGLAHENKAAIAALRRHLGDADG